MATLKELSEHTGYSIATISRILNNDPSMSASDETRKKVMQVAEELNYAATKSKKGRNQKNVLNIGVVFACQFEWRREKFEKAWLECLDEVCSNAKISWIKIEMGVSPVHELKEMGLDGILAIGVFQEPQINWIFHINQNVVFMDASADEVHYDTVVINSHAGMAQAIEHLMEYGHKNIGYFGPCGKQQCWTRRILTEVLHNMYNDAMRVYGLTDKLWTLQAEVDVEQSKQAMIDYIKSGEKLPTAIIAASMENALGAIEAFKECEINIPNDISILAFCDIDRSADVLKKLTIVHIQEEYMCRAAVRLISEKMPNQTVHGVRCAPKKVMIPPVLDSGLSVAEPKMFYN